MALGLPRRLTIVIQPKSGARRRSSPRVQTVQEKNGRDKISMIPFYHVTLEPVLLLTPCLPGRRSNADILCPFVYLFACTYIHVYTCSSHIFVLIRQDWLTPSVRLSVCLSVAWSPRISTVRRDRQATATLPTTCAERGNNRGWYQVATSILQCVPGDRDGSPNKIYSLCWPWNQPQRKATTTMANHNNAKQKYSVEQ